MKMKEFDIIVLDTNVLLDDPNSIYAYKGKKVIIPIVCIEEIDKFKKDMAGLGRAAREVSRELDKLRKKGSLADGVSLPGGGSLQIVTSHSAYTYFAAVTRDPVSDNDNYILSVAIEAASHHGAKKVALVSNDTNMRIKADALGIAARDYKADEKVQITELYTGIFRKDVGGEEIDALYNDGGLSMPEKLFPHQYVWLTDKANDKHVGLGRFDADAGKVVPIKTVNKIWGIMPKNIEQKIAFDLLTNDKIPLVTLVGKAGTGKTLLALAAGLHCSLDEENYKRLLVSRPIFPMGRDIGFLPGEMQEKLAPWMQPIFDNLEFLFSASEEGKEEDDRAGGKPIARGSARKGYEELIRMNSIVVEPLTYIRGRSIPRQYFIVDEAQNLTAHEAKTIISRAGVGTKLVLTGDPYQIDNPYLDASSNGLTYVAERMKESGLSGHVTLVRGERSALAQAAADLL